MNQIKEHITFKILTLLLAVVLLVPTVVKFTHILTHHDHEHEICSGEKKTHLHQIDIDCNFYDFQLNKNFTITGSCVELFKIKEKTLKAVSKYSFLSKYQRLHFSLRGPPVLI